MKPYYLFGLKIITLLCGKIIIFICLTEVNEKSKFTLFNKEILSGLTNLEKLYAR